MTRAPRFVIALLMVAALAAAHGGASLARGLDADGDGSFCCCPSPEECQCTANCCSHTPTRASDRAGGPADRPTMRSSISCQFPRLPDGSLPGATGHDVAPGTAAHGVRDPEPPDPSTRQSDLAVTRLSDTLFPATSPRAPPGVPPVWC